MNDFGFCYRNAKSQKQDFFGKWKSLLELIELLGFKKLFVLILKFVSCFANIWIPVCMNAEGDVWGKGRSRKLGCESA